MASDNYAIETDRLSKSFGNKVAVRDLTLQVGQGEVFGFLGPNGAGKTTSIKMLLALIQPSAGEGKVLGQPLGEPEVRRRIGFLPEHFRFHDWLTAQEFLQLHTDLYQIPTEKAHLRILELLELVGLSEFSGLKLRTFSKGMLQRIGLAQALLNWPDLVILDEPTSGLDPVGRRLVRDIIRGLSQRGTTVFLNSHLLSEVEITCDRVAFIKHGEILTTQPLKALMEGELSVSVRAHGLTPEIVQGLQHWSQSVRLDGEYLSFTVTGEADIPAINRYLVEHGTDIYSLQPHKVSLEDLFVQIVGTDGGL